MITYSDEDVTFNRKTGEIFKENEKIEGWSSDPNK